MKKINSLCALRDSAVKPPLFQNYFLRFERAAFLVALRLVPLAVKPYFALNFF
jgi:hypothetical protein